MHIFSYRRFCTLYSVLQGLWYVKVSHNLHFNVDFFFTYTYTNQAIHVGCNAAHLTADHSLLLHSCQISSAQLPAHA